jgi:RND family efflux transporter MFP subunit
MSNLEILANHQHVGGRLSAALGVMICLATIQPVFAVEVEGFTQPFRTVNVAAPDAGIIDTIAARVGSVVAKGQILVQLDTEVHSLLVESARAKMEARGHLESSRAELKLRSLRLEKLKEVLDRGYGRQEEVERAQADVDIAAAQVLGVEDDLLIKKLDYRRLKVELDRRTIRAPLSGVVSQNLKEEGEFVAPNDPDVLTLVQLDPLLARFSLRRSHAIGIQLGQTVTVGFPYETDTVKGVIDEISPIIDAESGTLRVKVRLENPDGIYDSGQRCTLHLPDPDFKSIRAGRRVKQLRPVSSTAREGR